MNTPECIIFGAGGHAAVLIELLLMVRPERSYAILDPDASRSGSSVFGVSILGGDELARELYREGASEFVLGIGSVKDCTLRARVFDYAVSVGLRAVTLQHPSALRAASSEIGAGVQMLAGSIVSTRARLGRNVIVNTGAIVEHDCLIGDHVHLATGARLAGEVSIGRGAHIGIGAVVRQQISIGERAVVGAGAVVVSDVPAGAVFVGNPARVRSAKAVADVAAVPAITSL